MPANTLPDLQKLRQAMSFETRHGYPNLRGHQSLFHEFVYKELGKLLDGLPAKERGRFAGRTASPWVAARATYSPPTASRASRSRAWVAPSRWALGAAPGRPVASRRARR